MWEADSTATEQKTFAHFVPGTPVERLLQVSSRLCSNRTDTPGAVTSKPGIRFGHETATTFRPPRKPRQVPAA
jgi:hypothetical protein